MEEVAARRREFERLLAATWALAREAVAAEDELPGGERRDPARLAAELGLALGDDGLAAEEVLERLRALLAATPSTSSWRFLNQLFGGREPLAVAAEMLAPLANVSMYTFKAAGAQILVERELLAHLGRFAGFADGEGCFTPGGSLANLVAMLLARDAASPGAREHGVGGERWTIYSSAEGHYSIPKNAGILGLGRERVRRIAVRRDGGMDPDALAAQLTADRRAGLRPLFVNATAGTTVRGAFDPLEPLAALAREYGAWLHVDAALGGSLLLSPRYRGRLAGCERADSLAWNPHKMMGVPLQCSALLVARRGALAASLDETAEYLFQADGDELNPGHRSLLCGRRNDAMKLWAAWQHLGDRGYAARVERQLDLARRAAEKIAADPALELAEWPPSVNVCFRVRGADSRAVCDRLDREGRLKIGYGEVLGSPAIRLVCVNPDLDDAALDAIFAEIRAAAS